MKETDDETARSDADGVKPGISIYSDPDVN